MKALERENILTQYFALDHKTDLCFYVCKLAIECEEKVSKDSDNEYKIKRKITIKENFIS